MKLTITAGWWSAARSPCRRGVLLRSAKGTDRKLVDADMMVDESDTVNRCVASYRDQIEQSRAVSCSRGIDGSVQSVRAEDIIECNVRYVMFHMIQETARHAGHADIIRETLDGSTGI